MGKVQDKNADLVQLGRKCVSLPLVRASRRSRLCLNSRVILPGCTEHVRGCVRVRAGAAGAVGRHHDHVPLAQHEGSLAGRCSALCSPSPQLRGCVVVPMTRDRRARSCSRTRACLCWAARVASRSTRPRTAQVVMRRENKDSPITLIHRDTEADSGVPMSVACTGLQAVDRTVRGLRRRSLHPHPRPARG